LRSLLSTILPDRVAAALFAARSRRINQSLVKKWGCTDLSAKLGSKFNATVQGGPFAGLRLAPECFHEHVAPYLLGTYESELNPWWDKILSGRYSTLLDVGAKFGYYAIGLARHFPDTPVVAFDTDLWAQKIIAQMSALNHTANVHVKGYCSPQWLANHCPPNAFILSDCEGFEVELFGQRIPALDSATMIIEMHEDQIVDAFQKVAACVSDTHTITEVWHGSEPRRSTLDLSFLTPTERELAFNEFRSMQRWILCMPKKCSV